VSDRTKVFWFVEWEYARTIVSCGPFCDDDVFQYLKDAAQMMSKSGYGEPLEAITLTDTP
jgi:hypothetical protein